jgi:hypothetical protein
MITILPIIALHVLCMKQGRTHSKSPAYRSLPLKAVPVIEARFTPIREAVQGFSVLFAVQDLFHISFSVFFPYAFRRTPSSSHCLCRIQREILVTLANPKRPARSKFHQRHNFSRDFASKEEDCACALGFANKVTSISSITWVERQC